MFTNAEEIIKAGKEGQWIEATPEQQKVIMDSIADCNLLRAARSPAGSGQGGNNLRGYCRGNWIVVHGMGGDAAEHPDDAAVRQAQAISSAKAVLGQA